MRTFYCGDLWRFGRGDAGHGFLAAGSSWVISWLTLRMLWRNGSPAEQFLSGHRL
ncbi:MAG TPA: hypothetical protein VGL72_04215 [Bryobacteraceae bacterium]